MKLKHFLIPVILFMLLLFGLLLVIVLIAGNSDDDSGGNANIPDSTSGLSVSTEVLAYTDLVTQYATENGIPEYVNYLLAIMQVESGGIGNDVMQSSESLGKPPNSLKPEESIKQGCAYLAGLLQKANASGCDTNTAVQAYNFGGGYIDYVETNGGVHSFDLAAAFAKDKANGKVTTYSLPLAIETNGGWRYDYGNMFYVKLVAQYLYGASLNSEALQTVITEALKYEGFPYVFGGSNPNTSFDCSGLTSWCYAKAGITLPRTAQEQYDTTVHLPLTDATPGDLVFFTGTYNSGTYITHVGIYISENKMYDAGDPIGYTDISTAYWQAHLVGAGRIK